MMNVKKHSRRCHAWIKVLAIAHEKACCMATVHRDRAFTAGRETLWTNHKDETDSSTAREMLWIKCEYQMFV